MEFDKKGILGRAKAAQQSTVVMDEGLRAYMLKVYNYMATGILLTGIIALISFKMSVVTDSSGAITGFTNILEGMKKFSLKKLIYASSSSVYGDCKKFPFNEIHFLPMVPLPLV